MMTIAKAVKLLLERGRDGHTGSRSSRSLAEGVERCEERVLLTVLFDPDGTGGDSAVEILSLDWGVGNALALGGNQAVFNAISGSGPTTFEVLYQASLAAYVNDQGMTIQPPGITNGDYEITAVARFPMRVTGVSASGITFTLDAGAGSPNFYQIYFDDSPDANMLEGTGFNDGILILDGQTVVSAGNFTRVPPTEIQAFDQFLMNDYPDVMTVLGVGGTDLSTRVDQSDLDPDFFLTPLTGLFFNSTNKLPFQETNPSRTFFGTITPDIGTVNGLIPIGPDQGGPDFQLEADANTSFATSGIDIEKFTNGVDAEAPPGPVVPVGSTVIFTYSVTNTGEVPLANVVVIDDAGTPNDPSDDFMPTFTGGDTNGNGLLDLDEIWTYEATRIATPTPDCQYTNVAVVTAADVPFGNPVTDADTSNHFVETNPGIGLEKLVNGVDADDPPGPIVPVGSTVTFTYLVRNTGDVPLADVVVVDDGGTPNDPSNAFMPTFTGGDTNGNGLLDLNEIWTYTAARIATAGQYANIAAASGVGPCETFVIDADAGHYFGDEPPPGVPGINIVKTTEGEPVHVVDLLRFGYHHQPARLVLSFSSLLDPGRAEDLDNYELISLGRDRRLGTADDRTVVLAGAAYDPTNRTVTLTPSRRFLPINDTFALIVNGTPPDGLTDLSGNFIDGDGNGVPGGDYVKVFGREILRFTPAQNLPSDQDIAGAIGPIVPVGSTVTFNYVVTNTGNVPLANVTVVDDGGTPNDPSNDFMPTFTGGDTNGNGLLDPDETWTYRATGLATPGQYTNVATTQGTGAGEVVMDTDPSNHFGICPVVVDFERQGVHHQPTRIALTYSGPLDPDRAENLSNYSLVAAGRDNRFGTADDRPVDLASAVYDTTRRTVTLTTSRPLGIHQRYQIRATNPCPPGSAFVGLLNGRFSLRPFPDTPNHARPQGFWGMPRRPVALAAQQ